MIFYCESRIFSGQERMFLTAACAYSLEKDCVLIINKANISAIEYSKINGDFREIKLIDNFNQRFSSLFIWFRWHRIFSLYGFFKRKKIKCTDLCVSQGRIESGNLGVLAAKLAGFNVISYIPMVHSHAEMGAKKISAVFKDSLCTPLYKLPNSFITISEEVAQELKKKTNVKIKIVENFAGKRRTDNVIDRPPFFDDPEVYKLILPGRLINKQKGQLDFIRALKAIISSSNKKLICYLVGDGPDKSLINDEIKKLNLADNVLLLGNRHDLLSIMQGCDLVVLPSKFEGVPLVLLEAAILDKDIIASDIVGFNNYLPSKNLFKPNDPESLQKKIMSRLESESILITHSNSLKTLLKRDEDIFKRDFCSVLKDLS